MLSMYYTLIYIDVNIHIFDIHRSSWYHSYVTILGVLLIMKNEKYGQEIPTWKSSLPRHPSHLPPRPESLVDLNYNRLTQEENAHIAFGRGFNALGKQLVISEKKRHLIPALETWNINYRVEDKDPQAKILSPGVDEHILRIWDEHMVRMESERHCI